MFTIWMSTDAPSDNQMKLNKKGILFYLCKPTGAEINVNLLEYFWLQFNYRLSNPLTDRRIEKAQ